MANYTLKLTPTLVNMGTEGSLDTTVTDGVSLQRTGFMEVSTEDGRKIVECNDGDTFDDTMETIADHDNIVVEE